MCICFPFALKGLEIYDIWYTASVLPSTCYWNTIFSFDKSFCVWLFSERKPCGSHINNTFLIWTTGNSVLGEVSWEWCLIWIQATIFMLVLLLLQCPHTVTHCIYTPCTSSPSILFQTSANPFLVSVLSGFKWVLLAMEKDHINASKGFYSVGVLLRFKTERQFNPLNFQPSDSRSILLSLLHGCFETYVKIQQNTATFAMTRSWIPYYPILFPLTAAMDV